MKKILFGVVLAFTFSLTLEAAIITSVSDNPQVFTSTTEQWQQAKKGMCLSARDKVHCSAGAIGWFFG